MWQTDDASLWVRAYLCANTTPESVLLSLVINMALARWWVFESSCSHAAVNLVQFLQAALLRKAAEDWNDPIIFFVRMLLASAGPLASFAAVQAPSQAMLLDLCSPQSLFPSLSKETCLAFNFSFPHISEALWCHTCSTVLPNLSFPTKMWNSLHWLTGFAE